MDTPTAEIWRTHIARCPGCARYDRVLRRGLKYLAAQPQVEPSEEFTAQLHYRLAFEDGRVGVRPITSLAAASVAVAAMLAFAAWLPVLMLSNPEQSVVSGAIVPASAVASEIAWHGEGAVESRPSTHIHQARRVIWPSRGHHVIEANYTPVVLESPIAPLSYARTVSFGAE